MAEKPHGLDESRASLIAATAPTTTIRRIDWGGGETDVLELGNGSAVVLVHGGFSNSCEWLLITADLARSHRVLAVDMPGHGGADPFDYRGVDMVEHSVSFLRGVLDALSLDRAAIVGQSIGGFVTASFAAHETERVERALFVGCPAGFLKKAPLPFRILTLPLIPRLAFANPTPKGSRKFLRQTLRVTDPDQLPDDLIDVDVANTKRNKKSLITLPRAVSNIRGAKERLILDDTWGRMPAGTTILWGENEPFATPQWAQTRLAELDADVEVVPIAASGHLPHWDQPEEVAQELSSRLAT